MMDGTKKKIKISKHYTAIIKIDNNPEGSARCLKYKFNDLMKFTKFLDEKWSDWLWYNVYYNKGENKGKQAGSFTKHKRPVTSKI